jgi:hypothetical protein
MQTTTRQGPPADDDNQRREGATPMPQAASLAATAATALERAARPEAVPVAPSSGSPTAQGVDDGPGLPPVPAVPPSPPTFAADDRLSGDHPVAAEATTVQNGDATHAWSPPGNGDAPGGCTQAQLRRFIKSRPYVPMHELRRRFELNGSADDVSPIATAQGIAWIGLSPREAAFVAELLRQGEIGIELCHDPTVAIVVGVYAMKPVSR